MKGVCREIFIISTKYSRLTACLLIFNFHVISHISVVARKWIIIIQAKYLMFPLFEQAHKQMRHQQFIARTITQRLFPTVRPCLAAALASASQLLGESQDRVQTTTVLTHTDHHCRVVLCTITHMHTAIHLWSLKTHIPPLLCIMGTGC